MQLLRILHSKSIVGIKSGARILRHLSTASEWQKPDGINTGISVYNCVHRGDVPFIVQNANCVTWYTCGPTVYDDAHIGHAVCYMKCDIIQRILRKYFRLNVVSAMNITDIDDKIIGRSSMLKMPFDELARTCEQAFWQDIDALAIQRPDIIVRVTEYMPQIIAFIKQLLANDDAYVASDGSVYFANRRANGKLQNLVSSDADTQTKHENAGVRRAVQDYALWKAAKPGEPKWDVPWQFDGDANVSTAGRPGWHTECSAMATNLFGNTVDVHAGGIDLKFPHHENEESQCCSYHKRAQWVNYWLHIGHLVTTDNIKMSKSLKNFVTIKEFLKHYSPDQLRMACLNSTYHRHVHFSDDYLLDAGNTLKRFVSFFDDTERFIQTERRSISNRQEILDTIQSTQQRIDASLKKDFDTQSCISSLMELVTTINKAINSKIATDPKTDTSQQGSGVDAVKSGQMLVNHMLEIFGCHDTVASAMRQNSSRTVGQINADNLINDIMKYRSTVLHDAKQTNDKKLFQVCDQLRSIFRQNGLTVKDRGTESTWQFDGVVTRKNPSKN